MTAIPRYLCLCLFVAVSSAQAQQLDIVVAGIKGVVQVRSAADQPWQRAKVAMKLGAGWDVRTGPRSAIEIKIGADQTLLLDRMTTIKMLEAIKAEGKIKTDVGMKYGRVKYDVKSVGEEVDSKIHAPSATLAIRGSTVEFLDDALASYARGSGKLAYLPLDRRTEMTFGGNGEAEVNKDEDSAVKVAREHSTVNSLGMFSATSVEEFENLLVKSGIVDSHQRDVLEIQKLLDELALGGVGVPQLTGPLNIDLIWNSIDFFSPSDLNLSITDPSGNVLSVNNPVVGQAPTQGTFNLADDGSIGFGQESASWNVLFDGGTYQLHVDHVGGVDATVFLVATEGPNFTPVPPADGTPFNLSAGQSVVIPITPAGP